MTIRLVPVLGAALAAVFSSIAVAGSGGGWKAFRDPTVQDFGHQWSTVGDPHNDAYTYQPPFQLPRSIGRTNYKYRMMTHEVTVREWYGFLQAYAPYVAPGTAQSQGLIGTNGFIQFTGFSNGVAQYFMQQQFGDVPIQVSWRSAARYANFLHNDQADAAWAFESGAYDTSTFGTIPNSGNNISDQHERSEGARFFLTTFDEWSKAGHWDPNKEGFGEGGWWQYPNMSDTAPVSGHPDFGGETNGGPFPPGQMRPLDAGSYPDVQSPWGLLDLSGGATEWMENIDNPLDPDARYLSGSSIYQTGLQPGTWDRLGHFTTTGPASTFGIRLASVIPSPSTGFGLVVLWALQSRSRKRCAEDSFLPSPRSPRRRPA